MSKISEQKALKAYPSTDRDPNGIFVQVRREDYAKGYDQAFQDFLEKAEMWLEPIFKNLAGYNSGGDLMNDFKNYMKDEM